MICAVCGADTDDYGCLGSFTGRHEAAEATQLRGALARKIGRDPEQLHAEGLRASDFPFDGVVLTFEDGSLVHFRFALCVETHGKLAVYTEHCGDHVFNRASILKVVS